MARSLLTLAMKMKITTLLTITFLLATSFSAARELKIEFSTNNKVDVTILADEAFGTKKRSIDARVGKRITETEIKELAEALREEKRIKYDAVFIMLYLPDMKVGAGAWATAIYRPNLQVRILGTTKEQHKALTSKGKTGHGEKIVGTWLDDRPFIGRKIELITKESGKHSMRFTYKDGSGKTESVTIEEVRLGRKVVTKSGEKSGEYFIILKNGDLQHWDREGLYHTSKKQG